MLESLLAASELVESSVEDSSLEIGGDLEGIDKSSFDENSPRSAFEQLMDNSSLEDPKIGEVIDKGDTVESDGLSNPDTASLFDENSARSALEQIEDENIENVVGTIENPRQINTINDYLAGLEHPDCGVPYCEKVVETNSGEYIEGVFPEFESLFDVQLPEELYTASDAKQFKECNRQLKEKIDTDIKFKSELPAEFVENINNGIAPQGYTWHHTEVRGKMQLVDGGVHYICRHTGGKSIWGEGNR